VSEDYRETPIRFGADEDDPSIFDPATFMDEGELSEILTKEGKEAQARWADLLVLQTEYQDARDFLTDVLQTILGVSPTEIQYDMMHYLQHGPEYRKIQAQRASGKRFDVH